MTPRRWRWIFTLMRHEVSAAHVPPPWPKLARRTLRRAAVVLVCYTLGVAGSDAASLRPYRTLASGIVRLSDLFDALDGTPDRDLGPGPGPGERITVEAPQLAAIARDFGVAWRPSSGAERAILERGGVPLAEDAVRAPLRRALQAAGAPDGADIDMPGFTPPIVPAGGAVLADVSQVQYDAGSGRFSALLSVAAPDLPVNRLRLAGMAVAVVHAAVLTHAMRPGAVLHAEDVRMARLRQAALRGNAALSENAVLGMSLRHERPPGQALTLADLAKPLLVTRNAPVRMRLEAGGLVLSAQGTALEDGGLGERVRVQNPSSRAVVVAEVVGDGEVRVQPGRAPVLAASQ